MKNRKTVKMSRFEYAARKLIMNVTFYAGCTAIYLLPVIAVLTVAFMIAIKLALFFI